MAYRELPIPEGIHAWQARDAERLRAWFRDAAEYEDGVLRWKSNGRPVPASTFRDAFCEPPEANAEAERREGEEFLERYRALPRQHDEETMSEMRAAFGEGATVVDVFTGHRTRL